MLAVRYVVGFQRDLSFWTLIELHSPYATLFRNSPPLITASFLNSFSPTTTVSMKVLNHDSYGRLNYSREIEMV